MHALNFTTHRSQLGETLGGIHFSCSVSTTLEQLDTRSFAPACWGIFFACKVLTQAQACGLRPWCVLARQHDAHV